MYIVHLCEKKFLSSFGFSFGFGLGRRGTSPVFSGASTAAVLHLVVAARVANFLLPAAAAAASVRRRPFRVLGDAVG